MATLEVTTNEVVWIDLIDEFTLSQGVSYLVQNTSSVTMLLTEKTTTPISTSPYHTVLPGRSMGIIVDTSTGIWVRGESASITATVTKSQ